MSDPVSKRPTICLNMIVRNEAHIVTEVLDAVAPHISTWVIVDTGSHDGTQDLIRTHMAHLDIPGELHERPWRDFGHNRTEALTLAQGHAHYIWVMDADDTIVGTPDFTGLHADVYALRYFGDDDIFWRSLVFRDGAPVRWEGVIHEAAVWDRDSCVEARLEGDYHIQDRHIGARNRSGQKYARDRDLLLAEVERNPGDARSVFYLAQSYFNLGDHANARQWFVRRLEMGGWAEEIYYSMWRIAEAMARLDEPWPDIQDAYLRAWEFRPTRAEPLYAIASQWRLDQNYRLGYLFAKCAAEIPFPARDELFVRADVYAWRATDERAVCASWIGKQAEAFTLWRGVLARPDIPEGDRQRIAGNRDVCVPAMLDAASCYPGTAALPSPQGEVVVSLIAGPDRAATELTLNSFLRCCTDIARVARFLVIDAGLSAQDREILCDRYGFIELADTGTQLGQIRARIDTRFWLHLGQDWRFFAPENLITRLMAVLETEPQVFQVAINFTDAVTLTGTSAPEREVRRAPGAGRYVLTHDVACGPAMFDTARLDRASAAGLRTASLDEVLCIQPE